MPMPKPRQRRCNVGLCFATRRLFVLFCAFCAVVRRPDLSSSSSSRFIFVTQGISTDALLALRKNNVMEQRITVPIHKELLSLNRALIRWQGALMHARNATLADDEAWIAQAGGPMVRLCRSLRPNVSLVKRTLPSGRPAKPTLHIPLLLHPFIVSDGLGHSLTFFAKIIVGIVGAGCPTLALPAVRYGVGWQMLFVPWGDNNRTRGISAGAYARASRNSTEEDDPAALQLFDRAPTQFLCVYTCDLWALCST